MDTSLRPLVAPYEPGPTFIGERGNSIGRATRELIIVTAEELFAKHGTRAVSLRQIGQAAGQRNNAACQYHFGTRERLIAAIDEYRAGQINERRWELLDELEAAGSLESINSLLHGMLTPHVESLLDPESHFLGFLARRLLDGGSLVLDGARMDADNMNGHLRFVRLIRACVPGMDANTFKRRLRVIINWSIEALANFEQTNPIPSRRQVDQMFNELVTMLAAALTAP